MVRLLSESVVAYYSLFCLRLDPAEIENRLRGKGCTNPRLENIVQSAVYSTTPDDYPLLTRLPGSPIGDDFLPNNAGCKGDAVSVCTNLAEGGYEYQAKDVLSGTLGYSFPFSTAHPILVPGIPKVETRPVSPLQFFILGPLPDYWAGAVLIGETEKAAKELLKKSALLLQSIFRLIFGAKVFSS